MEDETLKRLSEFIGYVRENGHKLERIDQKVTDMRRFEELRFEEVKEDISRIEANLNKHDRRITENEQWRERITGSFKIICYAVAILIGILVTIITALLTRKI